MLLFGVFLLALIFAFLLVSTVAYVKARQKARTYRQERRRFEFLVEKLTDLRDDVLTEADRWPIYARPVLFTEIDHNAQVEFAKAQKSLNDADQILPTIETIEEPETPDHFKLDHVFKLPKNLKTISLGTRLVQVVRELKQEMENLKTSLISLRFNRHQVEKKRLAVQKSIEELDARTKQINRRLKPFDVWKSFEGHNFSWVVDIADRCQAESINSISNPPEDEQGYIEYAKADVLVAMGNFSLGCIELFLESQKISRRYELDNFFDLFNDATVFFHSILEMNEIWGSWKKIKTIEPYIEVLPTKGQVAERSLRNFNSRKRRIEYLIDQVNIIAIDREIKFANDLEAECTDYWYSYQERKKYWEKVLGNPVTLPSGNLHSFQASLVSEINPLIDVDTVIKQSQMVELTKMIEGALEYHELIKINILNLKTELEAHKRIQEIVEDLLGEDGTATLICNEVKFIVQDTSPNLKNRGQELTSSYQSYSQRADEVRGADFPELLDTIDQFIADSEELVRLHESELDELRNTYYRYFEKIQSLRIDLQIYLNHIPKFEIKSLDYFGEALEKSTALLVEQKIDTYTLLRRAVNTMEAWIRNTDSFMSAAQDRFRTFESRKKHVEILLSKTKHELDNNRLYTETQWGWYQTEILPRIDEMSEKISVEQKNWEGLIASNWADYNIGRAISECRRLIKFCDKIRLDVHQTIGKADQKQKQLEDKTSVVNKLLQKRGWNLSQSEKHDIKTLVEIAQQYRNFEFANKLLNNAIDIASRGPESKVRNESTNYIFIYSKGGPIFLERVINSGNILGAIKMLQSKG